MFFGTTFASSRDAISNTSVSDNTITTLTFSNMILDELYSTEAVLVNFDWKIPEDWDADTYLHSKYQETIHAGNVSYSPEMVSKIKIKRRFKGEFEWKTIYEQPVETLEDLAVHYTDYLVPSNHEVEYAYVAVIDGIDTDSATNSIETDFETYFLCGNGGEVYPMIINVDNQVTYNRESNIIKSPGRKYPYVINNGITQYYSGSLKVSFIRMDDKCQLDTENGWKYRNELDQFLTNGEPKILKSFEGDMWMVDIINAIPRSNEGHYQLVSQSIEWVESGDPFSIGDLYDNGFINTDVDRK